MAGTRENPSTRHVRITHNGEYYGDIEVAPDDHTLLYSGPQAERLPEIVEMYTEEDGEAALLTLYTRMSNGYWIVESLDGDPFGSEEDDAALLALLEAEEAEEAEEQ